MTLPIGETVGTAMNALAHCAEALYVEGRNPGADEEALAGASLIARALPTVVVDGEDRKGRRELLEGAMHAGAALAGAGLGLGHAMAQALGGRYGIAHGAANAVCLPAALRFNEPVAAEEIGSFRQGDRKRLSGSSAPGVGRPRWLPKAARARRSRGGPGRGWRRGGRAGRSAGESPSRDRRGDQ